MTAEEHLRWAKDRARAYVDRGDVVNALASIASDCLKHDDTTCLIKPISKVTARLAAADRLMTPAEMRDFIEGLALPPTN